jgi:D-threo-aldose 1-dehydrogenase
VSVIPGLGSVARVTQTLDLYRTEIPPEFWKRLRESGLLHPDTPLPGDA